MTLLAGPFNSQRSDPKVNIAAPDIFPNIALALLGIIPQQGGLPIFSGQLTANLAQQKYEVRSDVVQPPFALLRAQTPTFLPVSAGKMTESAPPPKYEARSDIYAYLIPPGSIKLPLSAAQRTENLPQQKYEVRSDIYPNVAIAIPKHVAIPLPLSAGRMTDSSPTVYAKYNIAFFAPGRQLIFVAPTIPFSRGQLTDSAPQAKYNVNFFAPSRQIVGQQANYTPPNIYNPPDPELPRGIEVFSYQKVLVPYTVLPVLPALDTSQLQTKVDVEQHAIIYPVVLGIAPRPKIALPLALPFDTNNFKPKIQVEVDVYPNLVLLHSKPIALPLGYPLDVNTFKPYTQIVEVDVYPNVIVLGIPPPPFVVPGIPMPNLGGMNIYEAMKLLQGLGIYLPLPTYGFLPSQISVIWMKSTLPGGIVIAQSIAAAIRVLPGVPLTLTLSTFPLGGIIDLPQGPDYKQVLN